MLLHHIQSAVSCRSVSNGEKPQDGRGSGSLPPSHVHFISSPSNPFVKHCLKLRQSSSYRHSHASALVVGITPINEIARFQRFQGEMHTLLDCILLHDGSKLPEELSKAPVRVIHVSSNVMKKLSGLQSVDSTAAIALMKIPSIFCDMDVYEVVPDCEHWFRSPHRVLVLDGIQDPGNLGTLLRSAMAFGWDGVFLLPGCCDPFNEKALRAARGACFQIAIVSGRWDHLETLRHKFRMKMLAGHPDNSVQGKPPILLSQTFADSVANEHLCLVLGSEGKGLSVQSKNVCDLLSIRMAGHFESLNVSVAGGIFLSMLQRQDENII